MSRLDVNCSSKNPAGHVMIGYVLDFKTLPSDGLICSTFNALVAQTDIHIFFSCVDSNVRLKHLWIMLGL